MPPVQVRVEVGPAGAALGAERKDVVLIVDALRASTTIAAALRAGALKVIPVLDVHQAEAYLSKPLYRVAGERGGAKLSQLHYGNSPTEIVAHQREISGRILVLTTSNGTRCVNAALGKAAALFAGSTVNASAVAVAALSMARQLTCGITLVVAGEGGQPAKEDLFGVGVIGQRLANAGAHLALSVPAVQEADSLQVFMSSRSASQLAALGYKEDVLLCAQVDIWDTVPIFRQDGFVSFLEGSRAPGSL